MAPRPAELSPLDEDVLRRRVKAELRKRMRALRQTTPADACAVRSAGIVQRLTEHPAVAAARQVALFWPLLDRHEVDLRPFDAWLRARGSRVAYPEVDGDQLRFRYVADPSTLEERGRLVHEPGPSDPLVSEDASGRLDLVVVPAVAVDPSGQRIGYGVGYYDRALAALEPGQATIAVAYDFQLISEVPATAGDVPVHFVVTDRRSFDARGTPG